MEASNLWRAIVIGLATLYYGLCHYFVLAKHNEALWRPFFAMPIVEFPFTDMRVVTAGWECTRRGLDVLRENPCDWLGRPMNYPRVWTLAAGWDWGEAQANVLGLLVGALFLVALYLALEGLTPDGAVATVFLVLSPPVAFGIERGNIDLLMFTLVVAALIGLRSAAWQAAAPAFVLSASLLKLYPLLAVAALTHGRRRDALAMLTLVLVSFGLYIAVTYPDLELISSGTPRPVGTHAHGVGGLVDLVRNGFDLTPAPAGDWRMSPGLQRTLVIALLVVAILVAGALVRWTSLRDLARGHADVPLVRSFWAGGAIYAGTYAFGYNFDYRLVFVLLLLPLTCAWWRHTPATRSLGMFGFATLLVAFWTSELQTHVNEIAHVGIFVYTVVGLLLTIPDWIRALPRSVLSRRRPLPTG